MIHLLALHLALKQRGESDHRPKLAADMRNLFRAFCWPTGSWHFDSPRPSFVVFFFPFLLGCSTDYYLLFYSCCNSEVQLYNWNFLLLCFRVRVWVVLSIFPLTPRPLKLGIAWPTICQLPRAKTSQTSTSFRHRAFFFNPPTFPLPLFPPTVNCAVFNPVTASVIDRQMCSRNS